MQAVTVTPQEDAPRTSGGLRRSFSLRTSRSTNEDPKEVASLVDIVEEEDTDIIETPPTKWMRVYPIFLAVVAAVGFSTMSLLAKMTTENIPTFQLNLTRSVIQLCCSFALLYVITGDHLLKLERQWYPAILSRCVTGLGGSLLFFYSLSKLPLSEAVVVSFTHPVLVAVLAPILLREKWEVMDALGGILCTVGVILIARPPFLFSDNQIDGEDSFSHWIGIGAVLLSALFTSVNICLTRMLGKSVHPMMNVAWFSVIAIIFSAPAMFIVDGYVEPTKFEWAAMLGVGLSAIFSQYAIGRALQLEKAVIIANTGYLQVVFGAINDAVILGFVPGGTSIAGILLICSWALISIIKEWRRDKLPWYTQLRLWWMNRSLQHQKLSMDSEMS